MRAVDRLRARRESRTAILLYHRVAAAAHDPWGLAVTPANFDAQLEVIQRRSTVLPLSELIAGLQQRKLPRRSTVVTFDDGYADNLLQAEPILRSRGVPATVFVASGFIREHREFWWDELEQILLGDQPLSPALTLRFGDREHRWDLSDLRHEPAYDRARHVSWRSWHPAPSRRQALFLELWKQLQPLPHASRRTALDSLAAWADRPCQPRPSHRPLTTDELRTLAASPQVDIGAHTITHPQLSVLSDGAQRAEISESRRELEETLGQAVTMFAYPYGGPGDYTQRTVAITRDSDFSCACSAAAGPVRAGDDLHELRRCFVPDVGRAEFEVWLDSQIEGALAR